MYVNIYIYILSYIIGYCRILSYIILHVLLYNPMESSSIPFAYADYLTEQVTMRVHLTICCHNSRCLQIFPDVYT